MRLAAVAGDVIVAGSHSLPYGTPANDDDDDDDDEQYRAAFGTPFVPMESAAPPVEPADFMPAS